MKMLSHEELAELRRDIASLGINEARQDDLIRFIDSVIISFIDRDIGLDPVQLSLSARANYAFAALDTCGNLPSYKILETADPAEKAEIGTTIPKRPFTP